MRITIHVDDQDDRGSPVVASGRELSTPDLTPGGGSAASAGAAPAGPSAELAARAARIGAISAGPAPTGPPDVAGAPGLGPVGLGPQPSGGADTPPDRSTDVSAGPAPTIG
jgi:hypothetical protein